MKNIGDSIPSILCFLVTRRLLKKSFHIFLNLLYLAIFWWQDLKMLNSQCYKVTMELSFYISVGQISHTQKHFKFQTSMTIFEQIWLEQKLKDLINLLRRKLQVQTAGLFKYVWPFGGHQTLKGLKCRINFL